jgi:hypothetical protein
LWLAACGRIHFDPLVDAGPLGCDGSRAPVADLPIPNLVSSWKMDGATTDSAGGYDGVLVGAAQIVTSGRAGGGLGLAGTDGRIEVAYPDVFASSYTASLWFRTTGTGAIQQLLDREPENDLRSSIHFWIDDTTIATSIRDLAGGGPGGGPTLSLIDGCWHHAVVVREGADNETDTARIYVDGSQVYESTAATGTTSDPSEPFRIGFRLLRDPRPFAGTIDEVQVYDRALSDVEIAQLYDLLR